jgi:hypothetical protein
MAQSWRCLASPSKVDDYNKEVHDLEKKDYSELVEKLVSIE